jgi:small GTP-binding protein
VIVATHKICLLGEYSVGKTSLVRRYVYSQFDEKYISTLGVRVSRKVTHLPSPDGAAERMVELTMMLWDMDGAQQFNQVRTSYLRGAAGAVLVCDLTRPETLSYLRLCAEDLLRLNPRAAMVLVGNKADLADEARITDAELAAVAGGYGAATCVTSAKTGEGVAAVFHELGEALTLPLWTRPS